MVLLLPAIALSQGALLSIGPGDSIQSAIYAAYPGDVTEVKAGTYYEHLRIDKPIMLRGIGMPTLDATASGSGVTITANGARLIGFRIINSGIMQGGIPSQVEAGIKILSKSNVISENNVSNNFNGVYLFYAVNNTLFDNAVKDNLGFGIRLEGSSNNTIYANSFANNYGRNAYDDGSNYWNSGEVGNYYSDFICNSRKNGICSSSYEVPGGKNIDGYPLFKISND